MSKPHRVGENFALHPNVVKEVESLRDRTSKVLRMPKGKKVGKYSGASVHYKENPFDANEAWKDIDLTFEQQGPFFCINRATYKLKVHSKIIGFEIDGRLGGKINVQLQTLDDSPLNLGDIVVNIKDKYLEWANVASGLDIRLVVAPDEVRLFKLLKDASAPKKFKWQVTIDDASGLGYRPGSQGFDDNKKECNIKNTILSDLKINDMKVIVHEEEFTGEIFSHREKKTRIKRYTTDVSYPVLIEG